MDRLKKRQLLLTVTCTVLYIGILVFTVLFYRNVELGMRGARLLQNGAYLALLLLTVGFMELSGKPFSEFGWYFSKLPLQLGIGAAVGGGILLVSMLFGRLPAVPENIPYTLGSQLLVALAEESFFRGFLPEEIICLTGSRNIAVTVSAASFAFSHLLVNPNPGQLVFTFVVGILLVVARTEFRETVGLPVTVLSHWISNVF